MGVSLRGNGPASSPRYQAPHRHNGGSEHAPEFATSISVGSGPSCRQPALTEWTGDKPERAHSDEEPSVDRNV